MRPKFESVLRRISRAPWSRRSATNPVTNLKWASGSGPSARSVKPPLGQRLRTLIGREHRAALVARWFPRRIDKLLLAAIAVVIIAGTVLRIGVIGTNNRVSSDEYGVAQNANEILAGRSLATLKWAPGTSLMFAAAAILRGYSTIDVRSHSHGVAQYSQLVTEFATLVLVALIAWILAGPWAALIAVALMATYEPLIEVTRTYLSEPLGGLGAARDGRHDLLGPPARPARADPRRDRRRLRRARARGLRGGGRRDHGRAARRRVAEPPRRARHVHSSTGSRRSPRSRRSWSTRRCASTASRRSSAPGRTRCSSAPTCPAAATSSST